MLHLERKYQLDCFFYQRNFENRQKENYPGNRNESNNSDDVGKVDENDDNEIDYEIDSNEESVDEQIVIYPKCEYDFDLGTQIKDI